MLQLYVPSRHHEPQAQHGWAVPTSNAPQLGWGHWVESRRGRDIFKKIKQTQIQSSSHLRLVSPKFTCCLSLMRVPHPHTQFYYFYYSPLLPGFWGFARLRRIAVDAFAQMTRYGRRTNEQQATEAAAATSVPASPAPAGAACCPSCPCDAPGLDDGPCLPDWFMVA